METQVLLASVFTELLKNNPFKKEEQFDLFSELALEHFESIERDESPSDDFHLWWMMVGLRKAKIKYKGIINSTTNKDEHDDFLMSQQVDEWYKSTWIIETVLMSIPND